MLIGFVRSYSGFQYRRCEYQDRLMKIDWNRKALRILIFSNAEYRIGVSKNLEPDSRLKKAFFSSIPLFSSSI